MPSDLAQQTAPSDAGGGSAWADGLLNIAQQATSLGLQYANSSLGNGKATSGSGVPTVAGVDSANARNGGQAAQNWPLYAGIAAAVLVVALVVTRRR